MGMQMGGPKLPGVIIMGAVPVPVSSHKARQQLYFPYISKCPVIPGALAQSLSLVCLERVLIWTL
jgi:hypothetical protein